MNPIYEFVSDASAEFDSTLGELLVKHPELLDEDATEFGFEAARVIVGIRSRELSNRAVAQRRPKRSPGQK